MNEVKNLSLPLTSALARFIDVADLIKSRIATDDVLRELCDDYNLARENTDESEKTTAETFSSNCGVHDSRRRD